MTHIFEDRFEVKNIDPDGKIFDKVSRIDCSSDGSEAQLLLDINMDIYPMDLGDKFTFVLVNSLTESEMEENVFDQSGRTTLADQFEYVMYGKVFKYEEEKKASSKVAVYVSFGGLMMMLKGDARLLSRINLDSRIYLLMRKC